MGMRASMCEGDADAMMCVGDVVLPGFKEWIERTD